MPQSIKFYESLLRINKDDLDNEVADLPGLFYVVADNYLEALKQTKRLQERLDRTFASLASALRTAAHSEGLSSRQVTETQIKQEVTLHPQYRKLKAKLIGAMYIQDRWQVLKEAYIQKSFALKGLVSLAVSEQFQSPHSTKQSKRGRR